MAKTKPVTKSPDGASAPPKTKKASGKTTAKKATSSAEGGAPEEGGSFWDLGANTFSFQEALTLLMIVRSAAAAVS